MTAEPRGNHPGRSRSGMTRLVPRGGAHRRLACDARLNSDDASRSPVSHAHDAPPRRRRATPTWGLGAAAIAGPDEAIGRLHVTMQDRSSASPLNSMTQQREVIASD